MDHTSDVLGGPQKAANVAEMLTTDDIKRRYFALMLRNGIYLDWLSSKGQNAANKPQETDQA